MIRVPSRYGDLVVGNNFLAEIPTAINVTVKKNNIKQFASRKNHKNPLLEVNTLVNFQLSEHKNYDLLFGTEPFYQTII